VIEYSREVKGIGMGSDRNSLAFTKTHATVTKIYKHKANRNSEALEQMALLFLDRKGHNHIIRLSQNTLYADTKVNTTDINNGNQQVQIPENINSDMCRTKEEPETRTTSTNKKEETSKQE